MTSESRKLLQDFADTASETAFRELVSRYTNLVYSVAIRFVDGDIQLAQEVTQTVFIDLARLARKIRRDAPVGAWLHRHACYVSSNLLRAERRRRSRERQAVEMENLRYSSESAYDQVAPIVDQAINQLNEGDRKVIVLRFFEQTSFRVIGQAVGISEDAARLRVTRALEKLHFLLKKRGVAVPGAALATVLATSAVMTAPSGLAASISTTALVKVLAGNSPGMTIFKLLIMSKLKATIVGAVIIAGVAIPVTVHKQAQAKIRDRDALLQQQSDQLSALQDENARLSNLVVSASGSSNSDQTSELLRLRGEVGVLKRQLAAKAAPGNSPMRRQPAPSTLTDTDPQEQEKQISMARMNFTKQSLLALMNHAVQNQGHFPASLTNAEPLLADEARNKNLPLDNFEVVYQGSLSDLTNPGNTIIMREREPRQTPTGTWKKAYGFADGSSRTIETTDGNFEAWEQEHMPKPVAAPQPGR
jgi:RNA polymerase sigma factor (sigma-70 family)